MTCICPSTRRRTSHISSIHLQSARYIHEEEKEEEAGRRRYLYSVTTRCIGLHAALVVCRSVRVWLVQRVFDLLSLHCLASCSNSGVPPGWSHTFMPGSWSAGIAYTCSSTSASLDEVMETTIVACKVSMCSVLLLWMKI